MGTAATPLRVSAAIAAVIALAATIGLALAGANVARSAGEGISSIDVLSNRADLISGGDALVAVKLAAGTDPATVRVNLNGNDITSAFAAREDGSFSGVVTGLGLGKNIVTARSPGGAGRMIVVTNHPIGGPVFSGPQVTPYHCNPNASNPALGPAIDDQCNAPTKVDFLYRNTSNQFVAYDPANPPAPSAIQMTTTDAGKTVPFIVQRVTGTANRGIYQIAVLVDPTKPIEPWSIAQPWSHKLYHPYGGACGNDHTQRAPSNVLQATQLGLGFAVANSSLNIYANNCGDVVSAEATMMTKEIVIERYGHLAYTVGTGGSAGSMQQHLIATNYPGLLDGLMTSQVFPDHMDQVMGSLDCRAVMHYFWPSAALNGSPLGAANPLFATSASRLPVWGSNPTNGDNLCGQKVQSFGADRTELVPSSGLFCGLATAEIWSPSNPTGERCGSFDFLRSIFGVTITPDAPKGKGRSATDNVGVQYGLKALLAGQITAEQFVDLNSKIGGIDIDGNFTPERKAADPAALAIMYSSGRMNDGSGVADLPEIDNRTGAQMDDTGFHPAMESFAYRARLDRTNGQHDTSVLWLSRTGGTVPNQFNTMRQWLDNLAADTSTDAKSVKVRRAKPADLRDGCFMPGGVIGDLTCNGTWQHYGNARQVAGGPLSSDVMKCQLKPLVRTDYSVTFTDAEWAALQATFPTGVCDYSKPGVAQQGPKETWLTYENGPGGEALGAAPGSVGCLASVTEPLTVAASQDVCVAPGAKVTGPVTVKSGGLLYLDGATVTGPVKATEAELVRICGSQLTGPLTVDASTGPVVVGGDADTGPCAGNTITGPVRLTNNTAGVEFNGNRVTGPVTITGNTGTLPPPGTGSVHAVGNSVVGPVKIQP